MKQRIITALWGLPLLAILLLLEVGDFPLLILAVAFGVIVGSLEFYRLARLAEGEPLTGLGVVLAAGYIVTAHVDSDRFTGILLAATVLLPLFWLHFVATGGKVRLRWTWTVAGILYVGWMLSRYVSMRELDDGTQWVFLTLVCVFLCDTGAYFGGRAFGKHKMAPTISPKKTWEGAVSGFIWAVGAAMLFKLILVSLDQDLPLSYLEAALLGGVVSIVGQIGDLCESQLKRKADVKDSGNVFPGHGGVLDRLDSLLPAGVVVYYYALWCT